MHELGHGHQLGHVVDNSEVMHYSLPSGEMLRTLSANDVNGGEDVQLRSTSTAVCSQPSMTQSSCFMTQLSAEDDQLKNDVKLFPNPTKETLYIKNSGHQNINVVQIYNILGTEVYRTKNSNSSNILKLDVSQYARGMYLIKLSSDYGSTTKKLVVN